MGGPGGDDSKKPAAKNSASVGPDTDPTTSPSATEPDGPYGTPEPEETEETEPGSGPTGTTIVGFWRSESEPSGGILGLRESPDSKKPTETSVSLLDGGRCNGLRSVVEAGRSYRIGMLCEDKKELYGTLVFTGGDTLTITWDKGRNGTETFKRFLDYPEKSPGDSDAV
ncbi:hypothetical protein I3F58_21020 [Streptomyces sp. MUM 203J]|uniref:hypothetical protein n=1 Tax=Streptomyces sp. MUM 203J TaxID=2791990 RepID=UPI001F03A623|nr:hypothetical protein [Streptomyces sp. MUM 203J]MCH0542000.1 hypothetical protein [Streptomyces sp. MUM 203J]